MNELAEDPAAFISIKEKQSLEEEGKYLEGAIKKVKKNKQVALITEHNGAVVSGTNITLKEGPQKHVGELGIAIVKKYRGIGLGTYLMKRIIKLAKKELKPKPEMIRLSVASVNEPAISLYKKLGFKKVATLPEQFQYGGKLCDEIVMLKEI